MRQLICLALWLCLSFSNLNASQQNSHNSEWKKKHHHQSKWKKKDRDRDKKDRDRDHWSKKDRDKDDWDKKDRDRDKKDKDHWSKKDRDKDAWDKKDRHSDDRHGSKHKKRHHRVRFKDDDSFYGIPDLNLPDEDISLDLENNDANTFLEVDSKGRARDFQAAFREMIKNESSARTYVVVDGRSIDRIADVRALPDETLVQLVIQRGRHQEYRVVKVEDIEEFGTRGHRANSPVTYPDAW